MTSRPRKAPGSTEVLRMVLDDATVERLREAAERRGMEVEQLMIELLVASSSRVDELLDWGEKQPSQ